MFFSFLGKFSENVVQWFHKNSQMVFIENIKVDVKSTYFFKNQTKSNFHDPSSTNQSNLKIHHHGYLVLSKSIINMRAKFLIQIFPKKCKYTFLEPWIKCIKILLMNLGKNSQGCREAFDCYFHHFYDLSPSHL